MQISEAGTPVNLNDLRQLEYRLQTQLPPEYRLFLLKYNGGRPEPDGFLFYSRYIGNRFDNGLDGVGAMVDIFNCLDAARYDDLRNQLEVFRDRMPSEFLPIARDPGGNLICLAVKGNDIGKVFYWDHEAEVDEGEPPTYSNVYFVADSFDLFLNSLQDLSDAE